MLGKKAFIDGYTELCGSNYIQFDPKLIGIIYLKLKNKFKDKEFLRTCDYMIYNIELYGKPPTVRDFYKRRSHQSREMDYVTFFNKIQFIDMSGVNDVDITLSGFERNIIKLVGGLDVLYTIFVEKGKNKYFLLKELRGYFLSMQHVEPITDDIAIEDKTTIDKDKIEKIQKLTKQVVSNFKEQTPKNM